MPEELTSKQEATSPTSAGVLRSTCTFKWVHEFNLWMCLATTAEGNSCWACFCFLTSLCAQGCWHQRAGLGAAVSMLGQLWGFSLWMLVLQSHGFTLTKVTQKECFYFTVLLHLFLCYFLCPTDPFAAVPWYPVRSHRSLHGQCRRAGSPKDQPSHQQRARRAVGLGVPVKQRHWFGGLPVYNQLFPLCLFPCVSRLSLCDSNRINSQWTTRGQQPPAV